MSCLFNINSFKKRRNYFCFALLKFYLPFSLFAQGKLTNHVNPFIGTGGHGHTFPGAVLPFGMVQLSPDTRIDGSWDGASGYHYSDNTIYGFTHTHLSGTGVSDWGDILLMPMSTKSSFDKKIYSSKFSHAKEKASPGFYEVFLEDEKTKVELTVTPRTGIHRYTFPTNSEASIVLDLLHRDKLLEGNIKIIDSVTIAGYRISEAWVKEQHCYFAIKFSKPFTKIQYFKNKKNTSPADSSMKIISEACVLQFGKSEKPLLVKVGISSVSSEGALYNLIMEADHWDFEKYKKEAEDVWEKQLQKINVFSTEKEKLTSFYTSLYHCCIHPSLNMDYDNNYRGRDNKIHTAKGFVNYTVFSLWDTYRALHPLFTIIEQKRTSDFINTFLAQYKQSKRLPIWELSSNETDCMIGYHSVSVIADAIVKNIKGFDSLLVYEAVKAAATYSGSGIPAYIKKGYLSADDESESVSKTLEYAYDDWCISQIMQKLNKKDDYETFIKRAQGYKNVFDPSIGFMRSRKNGGWLSLFDSKEVNNHYTEGNSWQYSFYVPHDIDGLITLLGGEKKFEQKLDSLFITGNKTTGRTQSDITGLIGQYAHGNEPSHHMAYLYNFAGVPYKSQDKISEIQQKFYKNSPDGLIGNEDCGQMSAWYVFSALGFYPVCPGNNQYVIGKPLFDSCAINLENQKTFLISNAVNNVHAKYITSFIINKSASRKPIINHYQIINGGAITFSYQSKFDSTNKFGIGKFHRAGTKIRVAQEVITPPVIQSNSASFQNSQQISISSLLTNTNVIVYTLNGSAPVKNSTKYSGPFQIDKSCIVKSKIYSNKDSSKITEAVFYKKPNDWSIKLKSAYNKQYTAGGPEGLIDGIKGDINWRKGEWQGYQYQDFECVIDLIKNQDIRYVSLNLLQDTRSWIVYPTEVNIYVSTDNKKFALAGTIKSSIPANDYTIQIKKWESDFQVKQGMRYVKIVAKNYGKLPAWHEGKGDGAFIFIDEIEIK